jgi:hypothetical protein
MAIPRNKKLTKQLNSYSYVIAITLQSLLQRTKRALKVKRKQNFYGQTTYIVKVSFFDISVSINSYLAFNLEKNST